MILFNAIQRADIIPKYHEKTGKKLNVLISYPYLDGQAYKLTNDYREKINKLYLDSGAYSVSRGKVNITVSEYSQYINMFGERFDAYFNLDDKFDNPDHNQCNQSYLERHLPDSARKPIPVVHDTDDPVGEFAAYVEQEHDYIAIGSTTKLADEVWTQIREQHPDVKIHMFGNLDRKMLLKHKPYSADSASFSHQAKHGMIYYWEPSESKEYLVYMGARESRKKTKKVKLYHSFEHKTELDQFLMEKFGYTHNDILKSQTEEEARIVNLHYFSQLEDRVNGNI